MGENGWLPRDTFIKAMKSAFFIPDIATMLVFIFFLFVLCFWGKNSREYMEQSSSAGLLFLACLYFSLSSLLLALPDKAQEFIYFQF